MKREPARCPFWFLVALFLAAIHPARAEAGGAPEKKTAAEEVSDFSLLDQNGGFHQLRRQTGAKAVVLMIVGNGCPIVRQNVHKFEALRERFKEVRFWMLNPVAEDDAGSIRSEATELGLRTSILKDETQLVAYTLGVKRTAEVIAIRTSDWTVLYRGALDDQLVEGAGKPQPTEQYLAEALTHFLAGQPVPTPRTRAAGCLIHYEEPLDGRPWRGSYERDIAPLLAGHCAGCHSKGNIGPFAMSGYKAVKGRSDMIREVLLSRQMPPWHADPHYGKFVDDRSLSAAQRRLLVRWIDEGCPRGTGSDRLAEMAEMTASPDRWTLGAPDYVVVPSQVMTIPATGVVEYITNIVESPLTEDAWLRAAVIRPDNKKVLHHAIVYMDLPKGYRKNGEVNNWLAGWAPGYTMHAFPAGTGKFLPKGTRLRWQLHYTTTGSEQTDRTELGLYLLKEKPPVEIEVRAVYDDRFKIPPRTADARTQALREFPRETTLYELNPHMHKRGSWFRFEALYPDGRFETLLFVPKYDFNWQTGYRLLEPKVLPAGTRILCTGGFDNSPQNPSNPDPEKEVRWGDQSWQEMFIGFMTVAESHPHPSGNDHARAATQNPAAP